MSPAIEASTQLTHRRMANVTPPTTCVSASAAMGAGVADASSTGGVRELVVGQPIGVL